MAAPARHTSRTVQPLTIRARLILLFLLAALPLAGAQVFDVRAERIRQLDLASQRAGSIADYAAAIEQTVFDQARLFLATLARSLRDDVADCGGLLRDFANSASWLQAVLLVDSSGNGVCSSRGLPKPVSVADRVYFRDVLRTRAFTVSHLVRGKVINQPTVIAAYPAVDAQDRMTGVLVASVDLGIVSDRLARIARQTGAKLFVADGSGTIVSAYPPDEKIVGMGLDTLQLAQSESDVLEGEWPKDEPLLAALANIPGTTFRVVAGVSRSAIIEGLNRELVRSLVEFVVVIILFTAVVWLASERLLLRPMSKLVRLAQRFGAGDLNARTDTEGWPPEFAAPARAFNAMADRISRREAELKDANQRLVDLAAQDGLTGLSNRRHFDEALEREWQRAARAQTPLALISLDVDFFKLYNDRYGHLAGDECLRQVSNVIRGTARRGADVKARVGGEEFAVLLPGTSAEDAVSLAEHMRSSLEAMAIAHDASAFGHVSISCGVAAAIPRPDTEVTALLSAADEALYRAKRIGRNRVVPSGAEPPPAVAEPPEPQRSARLRES